MEEFILQLDIPSISQEHLTVLNTPISLNEVLAAIDMLKVSKLWVQMISCQNVIRYFNSVWGLGYIKFLLLQLRRIHTYWCKTLITLIAKEGKDLSFPQSYRTILLLNVVHEILTSILAGCLMKVLQDLNGPDQSDFLQGWHLRVINIINFRKKISILFYSNYGYIY